MEENILNWEEDQVHAFLSSLGFHQYEQLLKEHGITGEILVHLDHEALKDVGIHSVGHRLAILKGVYGLKIRYDVPVEDGHWVPPSEFMDQVILDSPSGVIPPAKMHEMLRERDQRIRSLEESIHRLSEHMSGMRDEVHVISKTLYTKDTSGVRPLRQYSPTSAAFANVSGLNPPVGLNHMRSGSLQHRVGGTFISSSPNHSPNTSPTRRAYTNGIQEELGDVLSQTDVNNVNVSLTLDGPDSVPLYASNMSGLQHSSSIRRQHSGQGLSASAGSTNIAHSPFGGSGGQVSPLPSGVSLGHGSVAEPSTPTVALTSTAMFHNASHERGGRMIDEDLHLAATPTQSDMLIPPTASTSWLPDPSRTISVDTSPRTTAHVTRRAGSNGKGEGKEKTAKPGSSIDNPLKSFRVTHDDPCFKVLPAALKKYKINDDWKQYALFICYGSQERCLSYEEKPLLLFQKLKDINENPVFMLRHIKDIASPIATAHSKQAARRDKRIKEGKNVTGEGKEGLARDFTKATRLFHGTQSLSIAKSPNSPNLATNDRDTGSRGLEQAYALAIYPYLADREDEFDVAVGDAFVILNKTKGWWVVHRDGQATSDSDVVRSGWVPQGCLLEISIPPASFATTPVPSSIPISPSSVVSVSTPGIALMDYSPRGSDEITMKKDDRLRVFKRYNYWSYVIKESSGERGWTPSWFVGKFHNASMPASAPGHSSVRDGDTTPTTVAMPLSALTALSV